MSAAGSVLVLGLGRSGAAAARLLARLGWSVTGYDRDASAGADAPSGMTRLAGESPPDASRFDRVIVSPGFPPPAGVDVTPEVDLAAEHLEPPIVGVTGTNGKSTVAVLIGAMLRAGGSRVAVGGNLGEPLCDFVGLDVERVVAELSSFQLERARRLRADVAVLLNLAPDHLDRHGTLEAYGAAKARLAELQRPGDRLVANLDDDWARAVSERAPANVIGFSSRRALERGAWLAGEGLAVAVGDAPTIHVPLDALSPASRTPVENALAAAAAAAACGASAEGIAKALGAFEGLPHRARAVCTRAGALWVDDSKATNPSAAAASLAARTEPVVWIAGGRNKGLDFATLAAAATRVRAAILIGEAAPALAEALGGATEVVEAGTLEAAVAEAARRTRPGDSVLLAPACTSLDQFRSFEERGERFAALARALPDDAREGGAC
jgi:UDP-N-acetylmuramoylalanine--D-glutamate ligase